MLAPLHNGLAWKGKSDKPFRPQVPLIMAFMIATESKLELDSKAVMSASVKSEDRLNRAGGAQL